MSTNSMRSFFTAGMLWKRFQNAFVGSRLVAGSMSRSVRSMMTLRPGRDDALDVDCVEVPLHAADGIDAARGLEELVNRPCPPATHSGS